MSELTKALIGFHQTVDKIDKNARGNYGQFADLANVLSTVTPALRANGLAVTQTFVDDSLVTTLHHVSGETIHSSCKLHVAQGRSVTQEWGKAVTYQRRYMLCCILGIVADMDTDGEPTVSNRVATGLKAIKDAKTKDAVTALGQRVEERHKEGVFTDEDYQLLRAELKSREEAVIK